MIVKVKRRDNPDGKPYWQSFIYGGSGRKTVAGILNELNSGETLTDADGNSCRRIRWSCSCMQKMCGACAMLVNKKPCLACSEFIDTDKTRELLLEPLSKFPAVCDLVIDRSCIFEHQKKALMFLGERKITDLKESEQQYSAAKCLKCGLCLEVCPNYTGPEGNFYGAVLANEAYLLHSETADRKSEIQAEYNRHFAAGCSKSLACRDICPANIETLSSIGYMNSGKRHNGK